MRIEDVRVGMRVRRTSNHGPFGVGSIHVVSRTSGSYFFIADPDYNGYVCAPEYWESAGPPEKRPLSGFGLFVKSQREKDAYAPL